jgi:hypothetical protein
VRPWGRFFRLWTPRTRGVSRGATEQDDRNSRRCLFSMDGAKAHLVYVMSHVISLHCACLSQALACPAHRCRTASFTAREWRSLLPLVNSDSCDQSGP